MNWLALRAYLLDLAALPSTYEGLAIIASGVGIVIRPDQITHIAAAGAIVVGIIRAGKRS